MAITTKQIRLKDNEGNILHPETEVARITDLTEELNTLYTSAQNDAAEKISEHNSSSTAHSDIREAISTNTDDISDLKTRLGTTETNIEKLNQRYTQYSVYSGMSTRVSGITGLQTTINGTTYYEAFFKGLAGLDCKSVTVNPVDSNTIADINYDSSTGRYSGHIYGPDPDTEVKADVMIQYF